MNKYLNAYTIDIMGCLISILEKLEKIEREYKL
jgi:hypothetical protein